MNRKTITVGGILLGCLLCHDAALAEGPSLLRMFSRGNAVAADPNAKYDLQQEDGPWLILAHTFVGGDSKPRAEALALAIRQELKLPAYVHRENFDFTGEIEAESKTKVASYDRPSRRLRYANQVRYEAHAVLVGEYDHAEHPSIDDDLHRVKHARLAVFEKKVPEASDDGPLATIKSINRFFAKRNEKKNLGPMGGAFLTRNPLLPEDYFRAPEIDAFVRNLNQPWPYSLLECPGKYTVVVRTFESTSQIAGSNTSNLDPEAEAKRLASSKAWLDRCADDADRMTRSLRKDGVEAYQFHDRNRSLVTIGSFDSLGENLPGGDFRYSPAIQTVMDKYRAFNVDPKIAAQAAKQTNKGVVANHAALIPFDVKPKPIAVPRFDGPRMPFNAAIMR